MAQPGTSTIVQYVREGDLVTAYCVHRSWYRGQFVETARWVVPGGIAAIRREPLGLPPGPLGYGREERVHVRIVDGVKVEGYDRFFLSCPHCPANTYSGFVQVEMRLLRGTYSERKECNARCMGATGPLCECSCAGANHGRSFA